MNLKRMAAGVIGVGVGFYVVDLLAGTMIRGVAGSFGYPFEAGVAYVVTDAVGIIDWAGKIVK